MRNSAPLLIRRIFRFLQLQGSMVIIEAHPAIAAVVKSLLRSPDRAVAALERVVQLLWLSLIQAC